MNQKQKAKKPLSAEMQRALQSEVQVYLNRQANRNNAELQEDEVRRFLSLPVTLASDEEERKNFGMAFDSMGGISTMYQSLQSHTVALGQIPLSGFVGYGFLQKIAQNGMIRNCIKATSDDLTREWIELEGSGDDEDKIRIDRLNELLEEKYPLQKLFNKAVSMSGFMGGALIFIDTGERDLELPLLIDKDSDELKLGSRLRFVVVDPVNVSPSAYNCTDPLRDDFMEASEWMVLGRRVHASRMLRIVFNEPPTLMKPAYNFLGIPQAQILWDYVAHWNACREAGLDVAQKMNLLLLKTNAREMMETLGGIESLDVRIQALQTFRSNNAVAVADSEDDIVNVQMTLAGLTDITRQAAEDICAINGTPATKTLSISPAGFNATGESDLRNYYDRIRSQQELLRGPITTLLHAIELVEFGEIDDSITFKFKELSKQDEMTQAQGLSARIGALTMLKDRNAISADELREAIKGDEASGLSFLTGEAPDEEDEMQTDDPMASLFGGASKVDTPSKPDATPQEVTNAQPQSEDQNG